MDAAAVIKTEMLLFSLSVSHLGQAGLCRQVLVVNLPQQPSLILLVHLFRADEQQGPSAALPPPLPPPHPHPPAAAPPPHPPPPLNPRSLPVRKSTLEPHLCRGKKKQKNTG